MTDNLLLEQLERQLEVASLSGEVLAVMHGIVEHLMRLDGADGASLSAVETGYAYFKVSLGADAPLQGRIIPLAETLGAGCVQTGELEVLRAGQDSTLDESLTAGAGVILLIPVFYDGATRGILGVRSNRSDAFTESDILTADMLARSAAIALRNAELVERVERSEREYRRLHDQASDAILVTDAPGQLLDANEEAAALLGYSVGELRSMHASSARRAPPTRWNGLTSCKAGAPSGTSDLSSARTAPTSSSSTRRERWTTAAPTRRCATSPNGAHTRRVSSRTSSARAPIVETQRAISALELDQDAVTAAIVERAQRLTGADGATVAVVEGDELVGATRAACARATRASKHSIQNSLGGLVVTQGQTLATSDASADKRAHGPTAEIAHTRSLISAPLEREGRVVGVLERHVGRPECIRRACGRDDDRHGAVRVGRHAQRGGARDAEPARRAAAAAERRSSSTCRPRCGSSRCSRRPAADRVRERSQLQATGLVRDDVIGRSLQRCCRPALTEHRQVA